MDFTIIKFYRNKKMLHKVLFVFVMLLFSAISNAQNLSNSGVVIAGDANGDAKVDVADISTIIYNIKSKANNATGDVNGDGIVDAADIFGTLGFMTSANADPVSARVAFPSRRAYSKEDVDDIPTIISNMAHDANSPTSDANGDGIVNVADITSVCSIANAGSTVGFPSTQAGGKVVLTADPVTIAKGGTADLIIRMDYETTETIAGVNFSLYLPDGIVLDGFDSKAEQDAAKASALKKACDLGEDGVWGEDATAGWLSVKQKADGGLLFVLIDQDDQTPFVSTHAKLVTIRLKALTDISNSYGELKGIGLTNDNSVSLDLGNIADYYFNIYSTNIGEKKTVLTADPVTIAKGGTADLIIRMDYETTETIAGVNFSLYLPDGIVLDGFDSKAEQDAAKASALKKACDLGEDGVWGEDAASGWLSVKQKADGGLLFVLIDQDDQTPFVSTHAKLVTIKLKALAYFSNSYGELKGIALTNDKSISLDNGNIADYSFAINEGGAVSNPVTITARSYTREYGDANPTFEYDATGPFTGQPELRCEATATSPVGTYPIVIAQGTVTNEDVTYVNGTLTITKAPLKVKADDKSRLEGTDNPELTVTYTGFKNGETSKALDQLPTVTTTATKASAPGTYPITVSGGSAKNYTLNYENGTLTVTAGALMLTAKSYTREYGEANPAFEFGQSGTATLRGTPVITCAATKESPVGTYPIVIAQGTVTNENVTYVNGTLTITKAPLTASVGNYTMKEGDNLPNFTISYSGFKNNEGTNVLTKEPSITCNVTSFSNPGSYPIMLSGGEATNYDFKYQNGILTIIQRDAVVITANSYTIEYGDPIPDFRFTTSGVELKGVPEISCNVNADSDAGTYTITVSKGSVTNEEVTCVDGTLTIKKAPLTASVGNYTKKQGDPMPSIGITYSGFKKGQTESVLTKAPTISCNANEASAPGNYPITLSGGQATNYDFNYQNGTLTVIAADAVSVVAKSYTITYGDALPKFEYEITGTELNGTPSISCSANSDSDAGTYDIVVSQGSVTNYNVTYVNGTLTIKKAMLTASVGDYKRKPGVDNPQFAITYEGFKKGQTKSVIDSEPLISCSATKESPAGTYPITLSGGSAKNYDFKYVNGVLTIISGYNLSIMSIGNGTTIFEGQTIGQNSSIVVAAYPEESYALSFKPETGYKLGKLLLNDVDIINKVVNNSYQLSNVNQTSSLIAMYEEALGEFTVSGITYEILSSTENTVTVTRGNYSGNVEIPSTVTDKEGVVWRVVGIQNFAFSNTQLKTVIIPSSVKETNMGGGLFSECQELAAITWNADFAMTSNMYSGMTNPNLLFYAKSASYAPKGINNVVVNGTAEEIILTDAENGNDFYCPKEFTAKKISYTHGYTMTSGFAGEARGWESIALPFDVKEIKHATKGTAVPFAALGSAPTAKPFWLFTLSASGFTRANSIKANTPYIISMPNNEEYEADYNLSGEVTFSATEAVVKASSTVSTQKSGSKTFVPSFSTKEKAGSIYVLNTVNDHHSENGGYTEGSRFVSALRNVSPFEAYMTDGSGSTRLFIDIEFSETIGIDELKLSEAATDVEGPVYNTAGVRVDSGRLQKGSLPTGMYFRNGKKFILRK